MSARETEASNQRVAILGAGTMGRAIARGALDSGALTPSQLCATVRRPERAQSLSSELGVEVGVDGEVEPVLGAGNGELGDAVRDGLQSEGREVERGIGGVAGQVEAPGRGRDDTRGRFSRPPRVAR